MSEFQTHHEFAPHGWMQHRMPWFAIFAFVFGLMRDEDDRDASNGGDSFYG